MPSSPSTEQLLVQVLLRTALDCLGALEAGEDDASIPAAASRQLELAFAPVWGRLPYLELAFADGTVQWNDAVVLTPEEDSAGLVPTLTSSGIRGLTLVPGVEREEMARLLELVDQKRRLDESGDQDLVLTLFRADLRHVRYTVGPALPPEAPRPREAIGPSSDAEWQHSEASTVDERPHAVELHLEPAEGAAPAGASAAAPATSPPAAPKRATLAPFSSPAALRAAIREDAATATDHAPSPQDAFATTSSFLDPGEITYLREAIEREYAEDPSIDVLDLLLDTLQLRDEPEVRDEVIGVLRDLLPYLLGTGRFPAVAHLTRELRNVARTTRLAARHKEAVDELRLAVSRSDALTQLFHVLDEGGADHGPEQIGALLREMGHDALKTVLVWIGQLRHPAAKAALVKAVEDLFLEWPAALEKMVTATDRAVVQRALSLAGRLQAPEFAEPVGAAMTHPDAATRRLAVSALAGIGTPPALRLLSGAIGDDDAEVRWTVYEAFIQRPWRGAQRGLTAALAADDLEAREISERRALFTAFAACAGAGGVAKLEPILLGKGGLARRPSPGTRACAAFALGVIDTPGARFALEGAAKDRDPVVRSAAGNALRKGGATG